MDLPNIETYLRPSELQAVNNWSQGWAWLAGGTWLFSEPQPQLKVLVDVNTLGWSEIELMPEVLAIGATCPLVKLLHYPWNPEWKAVEGLKSAIAALTASLKVINLATVGGNLCLALPVGTLAPIMVALDATYEIWNLAGQSRYIRAQDFQLSARATVLQPKEVLRRVLIPRSHLLWQINYQRLSIAATDPALAIVVAAHNSQTEQVRFSIGASVPSPKLLSFSTIPTSAQLSEALDMQIQISDFLQNARASAIYRQHITQVLMQRSLQALLCKTTPDA